MTSRVWPTAAYIRRITILYLIAAAAAALITFFVIALLYATKGTLVFVAGAILFLSGAIIGAVITAISGTPAVITAMAKYLVHHDF